MSTPHSRRSLGLVVIGLALLVGPVVAGQTAGTPPRVLTGADYSRAEKFLAPGTTPLVFGLTVQPTWLPDGRFWYRNTSDGTTETVLVDPVAKRRIVCTPDQADCKTANIPAAPAGGEAAGRGRAGGGGGRAGGGSQSIALARREAGGVHP